MTDEPEMNDYETSLVRTCSACGRRYSIAKYWPQNEGYFGGAYNYRSGCVDHCLACWLGVGPEDEPGSSTAPLSVTDSNALELPVVRESDPIDRWQGNILTAYKPWLDGGCHLAIMPIGRVHIESDPRYFFFGMTFFPPATVDLTPLNVRKRPQGKTTLAEAQSLASGVTADVIGRHHIVAFPCRFDWQQFLHGSHDDHLELLRSLSSQVDRSCLDFIRYSLCRLGLPDTLPSHAGQLTSEPMMAGGILYNHTLGESRVVGGAAFHRVTTRGMGLELEQLELDRYPGDGETGEVAKHALSLFTAMLEASDETMMFVQALGLMEFLAFPNTDRFRKFPDVKKIIARHVAKDRASYDALLERFKELTHKEDKNGKECGIRTRVVHMGARLESILPDRKKRLDLFRELQLYIGKTLNHLIDNSDLSSRDYLVLRASLKPFE